MVRALQRAVPGLHSERATALIPAYCGRVIIEYES